MASAKLAPPRLAAPAHDAHKYTRGMATVVGGEMPGAALLAASAALRLCGYVALVDGGQGGPLALVRRDWTEVKDDARLSALLIGSGLGRSDASREKLATALDCACSLVLDGDALTLLGSDIININKGLRDIILTPHEGEFAAMFGTGNEDKVGRTLDAAQASDAVIIHKGPQTVIAAPDGRVCVANDAPSWLASAGTGDVLAGLVTGLLATRMDAFDAACAAVWLHGEAARLAGPALIADDLLGHISAAVSTCLV